MTAQQRIPVAVEDSIEARRVGGQLHVKGWDQAELQARGDSVRIEKGEGAIVITCGDDLELFVPQSARLVVGTIGGDVVIEDLSGNLDLGLIGGDATLRNLSGMVVLRGPLRGETHLENVAHFAMKSGSRGPDLDTTDRLGERIRQKVEHATRRAEAKINKAEQKAHRYAQIRAHYADGIRWKWDDASGTPSAKGRSEPVTDEERMVILRMLQDKKITSEQAEELLAALESNA
ncbi:MAG TPA: hypothetical protein VF784_14760 [Anaerolineales bacterium]